MFGPNKLILISHHFGRKMLDFLSYVRMVKKKKNYNVKFPLFIFLSEAQLRNFPL